MLGLVNQDRPRAPVAECLFDGVVGGGGHSSVVRERWHRLRGPVDGIQPPLAVNQRFLHLHQEPLEIASPTEVIRLRWGGLHGHNWQPRRIWCFTREGADAEQLPDLCQQGGLTDAHGARDDDEGVRSGLCNGLQEAILGFHQHGVGDRKVFEVPKSHRWWLCQETAVGRHWSAHQKRSNTCPSVLISSLNSGGLASLAWAATWPS